MTANVTGGIGLHAADLLTTLKTGWLLGAKPRAPALRAAVRRRRRRGRRRARVQRSLIPDPIVLGTRSGPRRRAWCGPASRRRSPAARRARIRPRSCGDRRASLLGAGARADRKCAPTGSNACVPSPSGLGIAMVIPGSNAIAMFLGAAIAELLRRRRPALAETLRRARQLRADRRREPDGRRAWRCSSSPAC